MIAALAVHIPLNLAMVCINCEAIYKAGDVGDCPACAGSTVVPLVRWLSHSGSERLEAELVQAYLMIDALEKQRLAELS